MSSTVLYFYKKIVFCIHCSTIVNKKDRLLKKGSGYHLDILVIGLLTLVGGFIGAPFMVAATVRSVAHVSSLSVFSRTHAPGEKPRLERFMSSE